MIEQNNSSLLISFQTTEEATAFAQFLQTLLVPGTYAPPSESPLQDSPAPNYSRHVLLTPERQEQLFNQRQNGQSTHQRILRAQTTLRDGVLPFSKPGQTPAPSGQTSPRMKAQQQGGFADGSPEATELRPRVEPPVAATVRQPSVSDAPQGAPRKPSKLRPVASKDSSLQ